MQELIREKQLTQEQIEVGELVKTNQIVILSGKPGTGKTFATNAILKWAHENKLHITQCAPTGRAAKRMIEATGFPSATIHSTLGCTFGDYGFIFTHNSSNPLSTDLLIIDEASMVGNNLGADLLSAVDHKRTTVLIIGDPGQLPSVGAGAILRDLLASKLLPSVELTTIHRNSGLIIEACAAIHAGRSYGPPAKRIDLEAENKINLIHVATNTPERTQEAIRAIVSDRMPTRGFDSTWDVQVLSPVNTKGPLSCEALNDILQDELNPNPTGIFQPKDSKFRTGDKVINGKNEKAIQKDGRQAVIVNGDMGKILHYSPDGRHILVEFFEPTRVVKIPRSKNNLKRAYCVTVHKFQGSESPVVIIPVDLSFTYFATRKWLYTAISRAKTICITVGNFGAIERMIQNTKGGDRLTRLQERLSDQFNGGNVVDAFDPMAEFIDI